MPATSIEQIVNLSKRRGFVYQASEIYGGLGSCWDYGPLGAELKRNVKDAWWGAMVHQRDDVEGVILATQKADNAFRMLQAVRNKVVAAYEEVKQLRV